MKRIAILSLFACLLLFSCKSDYSCNCNVIVEDQNEPLEWEDVSLYESTTQSKADEKCEERQAYLGNVGNGISVTCNVKKL